MPCVQGTSAQQQLALRSIRRPRAVPVRGPGRRRARRRPCPGPGRPERRRRRGRAPRPGHRDRRRGCTADRTGAIGCYVSRVAEARLLGILTSTLVGAPILNAFHSDDPAGLRHRQNALLIAFDPQAFGGADGFTAAVDATLGTLKSLPVADGADGVHLPGERSAAVAERRSARGIPVAPKVWRDLTGHAERLGVPLPQPVAAG
ncbi:Ldh family oxidoreductase [Streptomyces sp. YIM S03343]